MCREGARETERARARERDQANASLERPWRAAWQPTRDGGLWHLLSQPFSTSQLRLPFLARPLTLARGSLHHRCLCLDERQQNMGAERRRRLHLPHAHLVPGLHVLLFLEQQSVLGQLGAQSRQLARRVTTAQYTQCVVMACRAAYRLHCSIQAPLQHTGSTAAYRLHRSIQAPLQHTGSTAAYIIQAPLQHT